MLSEGCDEVRRTAIAPKSLIFVKRYEDTDLPCSFLPIFYKMEVSTKIKYSQVSLIRGLVDSSMAVFLGYKSIYFHFL